MKAKTILFAIYLLTVALLPVQAFAQIGSTKMTTKEIRKQNRLNKAFIHKMHKLKLEAKNNPDVIAQRKKEQDLVSRRASRDSAEAERQSPISANIEKKQQRLRSRGE